MTANVASELREATPADIEELNRFQRALMVHERPMAAELKKGALYYDIATLIADPLTVVLVMEIESRLVASGYGQIRQSADHFTERRHGYIGFMFVEPEFRGRGWAGRIVDKLTDWFSSEGIGDIRLRVYSMNGGAIAAYERAGFEPHLLEMRRVTR